MKWILCPANEMAETNYKICSVICRFLLSFLHLVYSGLEYFDTAWALFRRKLFSLFPCRDPQSYVSHFVTGLKKCPNHFAIIIGDEGINLEDYLNLVKWCLAAGISFISFYDYTGFMKEHQDLYLNYLLDAGKLDSKSVVFNNRRKGLRNGLYKNGYNKKIYVNILSLDDGKRLFSKLVRHLSEKALYHELESMEIDEKYLDNVVFKMAGFGEPELAIISGSACSTFGFLPWHIRLTEFLQVRSIRNITVTDFTSMLEKYSSCQQRFGS